MRVRVCLCDFVPYSSATLQVGQGNSWILPSCCHGFVMGLHSHSLARLKLLRLAPPCATAASAAPPPSASASASPCWSPSMCSIGCFSTTSNFHPLPPPLSIFVQLSRRARGPRTLASSSGSKVSRPNYTLFLALHHNRLLACYSTSASPPSTLHGRPYLAPRFLLIL